MVSSRAFELEAEEPGFDERAGGAAKASGALSTVAGVAGVAGGLASSAPVLANQRRLSVRGPYAAVFPDGLRPGSSVALVAGHPLLKAAALRGAITLAAGVVPVDGWVAAVGLPSMGILAAAEAGLVLERLVLLAAPSEVWSTVAVAALDAFDVVVLAVPRRPRTAEVRRLTGRARERGTIVVVTGAGAPAWPGEARATVASVAWDGVGQGEGTLRSCRVAVAVEGRGAVRSRRVEMSL